MVRFHPVVRVSLAFRLALASLLLNLAIEASGIFLPLYASSVGS